MGRAVEVESEGRAEAVSQYLGRPLVLFLGEAILGLAMVVLAWPLAAQLADQLALWLRPEFNPGACGIHPDRGCDWRYLVYATGLAFCLHPALLVSLVLPARRLSARLTPTYRSPVGLSGFECWVLLALAVGLQTGPALMRL